MKVIIAIAAIVIVIVKKKFQSTYGRGQIILTDSAPNWSIQRYFRTKYWQNKLTAPLLKNTFQIRFTYSCSGSTRSAHISSDPHISGIWLRMFENICSKKEKERVYSCDVKVVVEPRLFAQAGAFSSSLGQISPQFTNIFTSIQKVSSNQILH